MITPSIQYNISNQVPSVPHSNDARIEISTPANMLGSKLHTLVAGTNVTVWRGILK
jgi:hypothetical protein